jgi:hypothetical protein
MCARCAPEPDTITVLCLVRYSTGLAYAERAPDRANLQDTIADIKSGDLKNVVRVIEFNTAEFSSRDITEDVICSFQDEYEHPEPLAMMLAEWDHARDLRKHEVR